MARSTDNARMSQEHGMLRRLGLRLKGLRKERGFTQQELGERCRLTSKYISEVERGVRNPSLLTLRRIAHLGLKTSLAVLFFGIDEGEEQAPRGKGKAARAAAVAASVAPVRSRSVADVNGLDQLLAGRLVPMRAQLLDIYRAVADLVDRPAR
ncbi:MAG: helix-turn-helix transcriptional regulator [Deltaproteobacteria bacterium]|nr:helix-turn-helix transcriptional regulator [Deltaproteobacteria bacterium]